MAEECANPLLAQWLKEWMDEAKERNSKGYTVYKKAYLSIKACPLRFDHPAEAQVLNGLGPKLCDRLADKLQAFCAAHGLPMPSKRTKKRSTGGAREDDGADDDNDDETNAPAPAKKARKAAPYVPKLRSGAYGLILALASLDRESNQAIGKTDLIALAQPHCDSSFTAPSDPTKFYTAWKSMETLERKELVCTKGHPTKKYYLSDDGWDVATRIQATLEGRPAPVPAPAREPRRTSPKPAAANRVGAAAVPCLTEQHTRPLPTTRRSTLPHEGASDVIDLLSSPAYRPPTMHEGRVQAGRQPDLNGSRPAMDLGASDDTIVLPAGGFDVRMVLDMREIRTTTDRDYISAELKKLGITPVLRALPLGDVLWIAEVKRPFVERLRAAGLEDSPECDTPEIVLEHILERKRLDDLVGSIKDGRFNEQKFRLHKSGIKHVTYLVEEYSLSAEKSERYGEALESAIASMQVVHNMFVKQTSKLDDTIRYLARMTRTLTGLYERRDIHVIPCCSFESDAALITLERLRKRAPERTLGMTFSVFGALCDKSESMTLRDVYLKMLMCTRGVTGEKAVEIQKIWPTPRALAEAFEARRTDAEKHNMISDHLGNAIPRKKVAKALSAKIAEIWA